MFPFLVFLLFLPLVEADCPSDSVLYSPLSTCYFFMTTPKEFSDAESTCNDLGGNLASIHDAFANNFIYTQAGLAFSPNSNFTIGFSCNFGNCLWTDGSSFTYNDFPIPSNPSGCGTMDVSNGGYWNLQNCFNEQPFVCQRAEAFVTSTQRSSLCPSDDWYYFEETNSCYYWTNAFDWATAETFCVNQGAHLASIHSQSELNFIKFLYNGYIWIGLHADDNPIQFNTAWKWTDGSYFDFQPWELSQWDGSVAMPFLRYNYQCVYSYTYIENDDCSINRTGICKMPSSKISATTTNPPFVPKCLDGWTYYPQTKFCYLGPLPLMSQSEAENYCTSKGGHLLSAHSRDELMFLFYATSHNISWVGFYATDNPVQINSTWQWTDGTIVDYIAWKDGIPSLDDKLCATSAFEYDAENKATYVFQNVDCLASYTGICKQHSLDNLSTSSPPPTYPVNPPSPCDNVFWFSAYFIPLAQMNWTTAEEYCKLCGGHLTSIHSYNELANTIVKNIYNYGSSKFNKNYDNFWIGLSSNNNGRTWKWVDGTAYNYSYWMSGYPNQEGTPCTNLNYWRRDAFGMTNGKDCSQSFYGICRI